MGEFGVLEFGASWPLGPRPEPGPTFDPFVKPDDIKKLNISVRLKFSTIFEVYFQVNTQNCNQL